MIKYIFLMLLSINLFGFESLIISYNQLFVEVFVSSVLIIACVISTILFIMIREFAFLFYSFYTFSMATILALNNQLYFYLFNNTPYEFIIVLNIAIALISALWFVLSFVKFFENREKFKKHFIAFSIFSFFAIFLNHFLNSFITTILHFFVILATLILIIFILVTNIHKHPLAKLLLIGWSFVFLGILYNILLLFKIVNDNLNYAYYYVSGSIVFETLIFALALGLKLKYKNDERIEAIQKSHKQQIIIEQQSRFATIGKVLAGVEHQWRSPINYLSSITLEMQSSMFGNENIEKTKLQEYIGLLENIVVEMDKTMNDFRYFHLPNKSKESFEIGKVFSETITYFIRYSNTKLDFKIDNSENLKIISYPNYFKHILLNLLENSTKIAKVRAIKNLKIEIEIMKKDDFVVCNIIDNVGGAKEIDKIFEPFYSDSSSGIGLYLVSELVKHELNGEILATNFHNGLKISIKVPFEV